MFLYLILLGIIIRNIKGASIVNGNHKPIEPNLGDIPYQASLMVRLNNSYYQTFCGGSLIHPQWVLTAAHCLEQNNKAMPTNAIYITLGSIYTNGRGGQRLQVERLAINKKYLESGIADIGLVKLKTPARLGKSVKVIKLHTNQGESLIGNTAYLTGYGIINDFYQQPTRLRKAVLHINTPDKCLMDSRDDATEICCTSTISEGKACKGDSGGPLTILKNGRYIQVGITSHLAILPFCKISFNNSVYTRVSAYIAWISKITGIDFMKYNPS